MSKDLNEFLESEDGKIAEFAVLIRSASIKDYAERVELEVFKNIGELLVAMPEDFQEAFECSYGKEPTSSIEENMNWNDAKRHFAKGWYAMRTFLGNTFTKYGEDMIDELEG